MKREEEGREEEGRQERGRMLVWDGGDSPGESDVEERRKKWEGRAYLCKFRHPLYVKPTDSRVGDEASVIGQYEGDV